MRTAGAFLLFIFCTFAGFLCGNKEKEKLCECEAFLSLFEYVKHQVDYFFTPTKLIYRNFSNDILEKRGFLPLLRSHEDDEVYMDVWRTSFEACRKQFDLSASQADIVFGFGECIGKASAALQSTNFDYYILMMGEEIKKQRAENEKNIKLYRTLGMAAGALAAILVI
ncbi:MAG: hypothetical protein E7608_03020 [Ruminococcaceae bacterium]|nr:hypothetical protein [Oscillospiraceae bacterium]